MNIKAMNTKNYYKNHYNPIYFRYACFKFDYYERQILILS